MKAEYAGPLAKLHSALQGQQVGYFLIVGQQRVSLNEHIGQFIELRFSGVCYCIQCNRKIKKTFQQGYCYPCYQRLQECNLCIIHPQRCRVEQGSCPKDDWAHSQCHAEHIVYLANASHLKVGITRISNIPSRWVDQGARQALAIFKVSNRYQAGVVEMAFKNQVSDKTNWRKMLQNTIEDCDLIAERDRLMALLRDDLQIIQQRYPDQITYLPDSSVRDFEYPVQEYPQKITSLSFDKEPIVSGKLLGIKGQYLLLDTGVLNVRKFGGYAVEFFTKR